MNDAEQRPEGTDHAILDLLEAHGQPCALVAADGRLRWRSQRFAAACPEWAALGSRLAFEPNAPTADGMTPQRRQLPDGGWLLWLDEPAASDGGAAPAPPPAATPRTVPFDRLRRGGRTARAPSPAGADVNELAQHATRLSAQLQVALGVANIGLWRLDFSDNRVVPDERGCEIIGAPFTEQGLSLEEARARIHPEDVAMAAASAEKTLRTGEPSDMELRYPAPGGRWRHVLLRRALHRAPDGRPIGFIGVLMDVSERVDERRRAQEYARRLESAAEAARVGLWSTRAGNALPEWNRRMFELFGLDPDAGPLALPDWLARCVHPDDRERIEHLVLRWWRRGHGAQDLEFRVVRPSDGVVRWLVVRGRIERSGVEGGRYAEGVAIDITEQQDTLRRLRETVQRMALTTRALGLGTWSSDAGHLQVHWDEQMFRLRGVGSPARRVSAEEIPTYLHPDDRAQVMEQQLSRVADRHPWHAEFRVLHPDGTARWITSHSVPVFDERGRPDGRIGVNWDSTDTRQAAEALREREVAVAENQAKSATMSRISHELRTPLNAILGFTQLMRSPDSALGSEQRTQWLGHVEDAARHLLALIDDVLELSRAQVGELRLAVQPVRCDELMAATLPLVEATARERDVTLRLGAIEGVVMADPVRLRQVLLNLMSNAIKYNRRGGSVELSSRVAGPVVDIEVTDTGIGIDPERLRHAFEPFARLGAEAGEVEGSGLGLAIVKMLVEGMGGSVQARSEPGSGSTFAVQLPIAPTVPPLVPPPATAAARPTQPKGRPARVLYVEDNPVNAMLVREMLSHRPHLSVEIVEDGHSAVRRAIEEPPDLLLVDLQLPDIDGHTVVRLLRGNARSAHVRCVALSANATPDDLEAARSTGFVAYWTKPIEFQPFLAAVDAVLEGNP